jgi:putative N6-adenine-specific DNA methylase
VTSLEGIDWKRLTLHEAPGPFDFFTVDVSFVAARNMLRALAFRLRPGAEGVVLIKPQFELPDRQVRGGRVDDPNLRRAAVDKVRRKAEALGFVMLDHGDSPVAGESGTVEILAHLRFEGRSAALPAPGERRRKPGAADRQAGAAPEVLRWFAVVAPGLEAAAAREVAALPGARDVTELAGGVEWTGAPEIGYRANLWLRIATRVLARVGAVEAREFGKLRRRIAQLPWAPFLPPGAALAVRAATSRCRLYHTAAIAETVVLGVGDAVAGAHLAADDEPAAATILARGASDQFTLSVDTSGERLHRRGARVEVGQAPLRETLAAGLLALCDWTPEVALADPMCGAGTIPIEAGMIALDIAPGLARSFALDAWPLYARQPELGAALLDEARSRVRASAPAAIVGSDRDPAAVATARRNAERAGLGGALAFACADISDARAPAPSGVVVVNPPYGRRLGDPRAIGRAYRDLGRMLRARFAGWRFGILVPARIDAAVLRLPVSDRYSLVNGGLRVALLQGEIPRQG